MEITKAIKLIDTVGRVLIPIKIREQLDLDNNTELQICVDGEKLIMTKTEKRCNFCKSSKELIEFKGKQICVNCLEDLIKYK